MSGRFRPVVTNLNKTAEIGMEVDYAHRRVNTTQRGTVDLEAIANIAAAGASKGRMGLRR